MSVVKKISDKELIDFVNISNNAYPSFSANTLEEKEKVVERFIQIQNEVPNENFYGLYKDDKLLGGMLLHDFKMNMLQEKINSCGVGMVAVDFLHKKEKVAKELISYYLKHYKENGVNMALLYPFRPDFYKKMGFGYGTKMSQYKIKPQIFPKNGLKNNVQYLNENDIEEIKECYNKYVDITNGMIELTYYEYKNLFKNPKVRIVGYKNNNQLEGFMAFSFNCDKDNFLITDILVHKFIYNTRESLLGIFGFLNSQSDQIRYVTLNTQDDYFHHLLNDPRNNSLNIIPHVYHESNTQGVGLMYRVIDTQSLFKELEKHNFNNETLKLKVTIHDDFIEQNNGSILVNFNKGYSSINNAGNYDVEINMDVSDFSSMIMGVIDFKTLYKYSLANISNTAYIDSVNNIFKTDKPICMTGF